MPNNNRQKPIGTHQDQRSSRMKTAPVVPAHIDDPGLPSRGIELRPGEFAMPTPPAPANILSITRSHWKALWASPLREYLISADIIVVRRYFEYLDVRERAYRSYLKEPMGIGSTGQEIVSPHWGVVKDAEKMCRTLEDAIGVGPQARMRLGIAYGDAVTKLHEAYRLGTQSPGGDGLPGDVVEMDS